MQSPSSSSFSRLLGPAPVDVVIVGAGLAGLCAALAAVERHAGVVLIEKETNLYREPALGRALYINAVDPERQGELGIADSPELFFRQTQAAGLGRGDPALQKVLCYKAYIAVKWLEGFGVRFENKVRQIPGGAFPRTCVVPDALAMRRALLRSATAAGVTILSGMTFEALYREKTGRVRGVFVHDINGDRHLLTADAVVMATGGFAGDAMLCARHDRRLSRLPTLRPDRGEARGLRAMVEAGGYPVGMDFIELTLGTPDAFGQFVPQPFSPLDALLVNRAGERVANETDREAVREAILSAEDATLMLLLSFSSVRGLPDAQRRRIEGLLETGVARRLDARKDEDCRQGGFFHSPPTLRATLARYGRPGPDAFGKAWHDPLTAESLLALPVTLARAVSLGGIRIDESARVLGADATVIEGLFAAGEVTGGIHGAHAVPGNLALESVVFGRVAGFSSVR